MIARCQVTGLPVNACDCRVPGHLAPACTCHAVGGLIFINGHKPGCAVTQAYVNSGPPPTPAELELRQTARRLGVAAKEWMDSVEAEAREEWAKKGTR